MNELEIARIADAMSRLRSDWPAKQLVTLLHHDSLVGRPRRDVLVALVWVASEAGTASPYRVLEAGPWWRAAAVDDTPAPRRETYDPGENCSVCSLTQDRCRRTWTGDHEYVSAAQHARTVTTDRARIRRIVEAVKAEKVPMREPSKVRADTVVRRDHADCEDAMVRAMERGRFGEAEYLAARCDRLHGDLTAPPSGEPQEATP